MTKGNKEVVTIEQIIKECEYFKINNVYFDFYHDNLFYYKTKRKQKDDSIHVFCIALDSELFKKESIIDLLTIKKDKIYYIEHSLHTKDENGNVTAIDKGIFRKQKNKNNE